MNSPSKDIYTCKEIVHDSNEHILLNALGGKLQASGIIDKKTNDTFGQTIDQDLLKMVEPFRVILNIRKGDGGSPPFLRAVTSEDSSRVDILPGGVPTLAHPSMKTEAVGGRKVLNASFRTIEEAKKHISVWAARHAPNMVVNEILKQAIEKSSQPTLDFELVLNPGGRRCIAKMACNLFSLANRPCFLMSDFDVIRDFVREDSAGCMSIDALVHAVDSPLDINWDRTGYSSLDHVIGFDLINGQVVGFVVLFGYLQFRVQLGRSSIPLNKQRSTYRVNPFLGQDRIDRDLIILDAIQEAKPATRTADSVTKGIKSLLEYMKDPLGRIDTNGIIARHARLGMTLTDDVITKISQDFSSEVTDFCRIHGLSMRPTI